MMSIKKIYCCAFFFLSLFLAAGFISSLPVLSQYTVVKDYLKQCTDSTAGEAGETTEKEEVKNILSLADADFSLLLISKKKIPLTNEKGKHLFTPSIFIPPPEFVC